MLICTLFILGFQVDAIFGWNFVFVSLGVLGVGGCCLRIDAILG